MLDEAKEVFVCSTSRFIVCGTSVDGVAKETAVSMELRKDVISHMLENTEIL